MKIKLLIAILFASTVSSAQIGYLPRNTKEKLIAHASDSTLHGPAGAFPSLRGGWPRSGPIFTDTVGGGVGFWYFRSATWRRLTDSTELADTAAAIRASITGGGGGGSGTVNSGNQYRLGYYATSGTAISEAAAITANRALISDANGVPTHSTVTNTELGYVSGVTSALQTQLGNKQALNSHLTAISGLTPTNDDVMQYKSGAWANRTIAQLKTDLNYTIPAQLNPTAGTNVTITGTYPDLTWNSAGDPNWVFLSDYGTPDDGLSDTAAIKAAVATGKNVYVTPGEWLWDGWRCTLNSNQIIRGYGPTSIIRFTKDTANVFWIPQGTHHVQIDYINFIGKGRGAAPGGEVFTESNAIFIQGDSNRVQYCNFKAVKGSGIHAWVAAGTMYANEVSYCRFDSCGVGIYALNNAEYSLFLANQAYYCRWGFYERCAGNNTWDAFTSNYNDVGFGLLGSDGCNGDHGSVSNARINHNTTALDVRQCNNEYLFENVKFYNGAVNIGSLDTAKRVLFSNCVLSGNTFTVTKALSCQFSGGTFGTTAVTIVGSDDDEYFTFCNVQNSPYSGTPCGGSASLTNPMTTAEDIIVGGVSGSPTRLAIGANGTFLGASGGTLQYLSLPGGGDVSKVGTPVNNQIGVWTGDGTIEGDANFTWSGSAFAVTGTSTISTSLTSPLIVGSTTTTGDLDLRVTSGVGATGAEFRVSGGNNGATNFYTINNAGEWGVGVAPVAGFKWFMKSNAAGDGTVYHLWRNSSDHNVFQMSDLGSTRIGNQSLGTSVNNLYNKNMIGGAGTPTAWAHIIAGTSSVAQLKLDPSTLLGTTQAGAIENDGTHLYYTASNGGTRFQLDQQGGFSNPLTTTGDIIYSSSGTTADRRGIGSTNQVLQVVSGVPNWGLILDKGTWAPTIAGLSNVASSNGPTGNYIRVGDMVYFTIFVIIEPTSGATNTSFTATLPIASDLTAGTDVIGNCSARDNTTQNAGFASAATGSDLINVQFTSVTTSGHSVYVTGSYIIQ